MNSKEKRGAIAPSILSADFSRLKEEVLEVEKAGADWIHVDVMDGHFVPNLTIGPLVVKAIRPVTKMALDCHLMVSEPEKWIEPFAKAGADWITIHAEVAKDLPKILRDIRALGCKAGVSINPDTSLSAVEKVLDQIDLVLVMSVNPGFGGQKYIDSATTKIQKLSALRKNRDFLIEVDGGITPENIHVPWKAGCDAFVAGSAVFNQSDRKKAIEALKAALT